MPSSLNASTTLSVRSACGEAARLCFWHCVNSPPPRALHVFFSLCLSFCFPLFSSISFHLYSWTPREATSHFVEWILVCVHLIWGRNCLHFSFSYFICTIIDCFCPHANMWRIECVCFESLEWPNTHTHTHITQNHYRAHRSGSVVQMCRRTYWPANCDLRALFLLTWSDHLHCTAGRKGWSILSLRH